MLSSLRNQLADIHADNIDDVIGDLKIWTLAIESYLSFLRYYPEFGARVAEISLANEFVIIETNAIATYGIEVWPPNMNARLGYITGDINRTEAVLKECLTMLNSADTRSNTLKFSIERLLS